MRRRVPRAFSPARAFCVLFFLGVHSCVLFAASTGTGRDVRTILDRIPSPDVRYPAPASDAGFETAGTKPPVSPAEPEPSPPDSAASVPLKLQTSFQHVASGTRAKQTDATAVKAASAPNAIHAVASATAVKTSAGASIASAGAIVLKVSSGEPLRDTQRKASASEKTTPQDQGKRGPVPVKESSIASASVRIPPAQPAASAPLPRIPKFSPASATLLSVPTPASASAPAPTATIASSVPAIALPVTAASTVSGALPASTAEAVPTASQPQETSAGASFPSKTASPSPAILQPDAEVEPVAVETTKAEQQGGTASADVVLQKAREYHDVGSFKKMLALLDENQELVGGMPEAAALRLEQLLLDPKPDYRLMRSAANIILERNGNDANANYAMGLYWSSLKKPDLGKALQHLGIARKAKQPPPGTTSLYWWLFAKNFWYFFLIPLLAAAAAIDKMRKKQPGAPIEETAPEAGRKGRLYSLLETLKGFPAKLRRKPAPPNENPPSGPDAGSGSGEGG